MSGQSRAPWLHLATECRLVALSELPELPSHLRPIVETHVLHLERVIEVERLLRERMEAAT